MKRFLSVLLVISLLFSLLCGCNDSNTISSDIISKIETENSSGYDKIYREHQELSAFQATFDDNMMRVSIPEVGLENVFVEDMSSEGLLDVKVYGPVYLLADDRYGGSGIPVDHYLAVKTGDKLIVKDISKWEDNACYSGHIDLCDIDGDNFDEIIVQECVSVTGGYGGYLSRIFDYVDGNIVEMFSNDSTNEFDTGFSIKILKGNKFTISNKFTGYSETFQDKRKNDEYYKGFWYDKNGEPSETSIMVDSFYEFLPFDVDEDGICEIVCRQYVSLIGHADGIGIAKTVLKYNKETKEFDIIDSDFDNNDFSNNIPEWKTAYLDFLEDKNDEYVSFALVYIDNDEIPELYMNGVSEATGDSICSYKNGNVIEECLNRTGGGRYIEKAGAVINQNGNMGNCYTHVYNLSEEGFIITLSAHSMENYIPLENDEYEIFYEYSVEDVSVNEYEYNSAIDSAFDFEQSIALNANAVSYSEVVEQILDIDKQQ